MKKDLLSSMIKYWMGKAKEAIDSATILKGENFIYNPQGIRNLDGVIISNGKNHPSIIKNLNQLFGGRC